MDEKWLALIAANNPDILPGILEEYHNAEVEWQSKKAKEYLK